MLKPNSLNTAERVTYDMSSLQLERSVSVTRQASSIDYTCLRVAHNNNSRVGTPLSEVLDLGTELGETSASEALYCLKLIWKGGFLLGSNLIPDAG